MKVLWLCNIIPGAVRAHMGGSNDGGMWTDHVLSDLRQQKLTMLLLCRGGDRSGRLDDRTAYALFSEEKPHVYSLSLETQFGIRLKEFEPDVIHIWGTEYGHCLAMVNAAEKAGMADRVVISIQGLCSVCGARPPRPGFKSCLECAIKRRRYANKSHWKYGTVPKVLMDGISLCNKCGKAPPVEGYKVCERCLDGCRRALENVPSHKGIALESSGFVRALRADYQLNKKERK